MKKSRFNLSHPASFTAKMGNLIPFCVIDCLPGDTHRIGTRSFIRVQPMLAPLMHQVNFFTQWWFVPYRILWNEWQDFITGGESGTAAPTFPTIKINPQTSSLADYFGIPPNGKELEVSALPFRAYAEIWNTRYRDEDLQNEIAVSYDSGLDEVTSTELKKCAWAKDYFTTSRPFTQRGAQISVPVNSVYSSNILNYSADIEFSVCSPSEFTFSYKRNMLVTSPINGKVNIVSLEISKAFLSDNFSVVNNHIDISFSGRYTPTSAGGNFSLSTNFSGVTVTFNQPAITEFFSAESFSLSGTLSIKISNKNLSESSVVDVSIPYKEKKQVVFASTSNYNSLNIRDLRLASATQRYQENSMQWGNRYEEFIQREFKVRPRDARIQRPEYLGGAKTRLQISEVLQTSEGTDTGVGTMRGHGVGAMSSRRIKFSCPEHGVIIGIFSIRPHAITTQGLNRMWRKFSKFDFFTPEFAHIGMQEVFQSELYANGENYDTVFGYSDRYGEYRKIPARISGEFRNLLDYWNLARIFDAPPVLNSSFIEMNPSTRIFAEQTKDQFLCMLQNDIFSYRPVPKKAKNILM